MNVSNPLAGVRSTQLSTWLHCAQKTTRNVLLATVIVGLLSACQFLNRKPEPVEAPPPVEEPVVQKPIYSAAPIKAAPRTLLKFAQTALKKLGYRIGRIDGIWGPRSASAIRQFEVDRDLWSADGHLSELNLHYLTEESQLSLATFKSQPKPVPKGIAGKLRGTASLEKGPQLIIVERGYEVFTKPNPYSAKLAKLEPGTGIYVVSKQPGWYEIESVNRLKGFIKAD